MLHPKTPLYLILPYHRSSLPPIHSIGLGERFVGIGIWMYRHGGHGNYRRSGDMIIFRSQIRHYMLPLPSHTDRWKVACPPLSQSNDITCPSHDNNRLMADTMDEILHKSCHIMMPVPAGCRFYDIITYSRNNNIHKHQNHCFIDRSNILDEGYWWCDVNEYQRRGTIIIYMTDEEDWWNLGSGRWWVMLE